jgi:hypothetical protein
MTSILVYATLSTLTTVASQGVVFEHSAQEVAAYDFVEVTLKITGPTATNPFQDVSITGEFQRENAPSQKIEGFCDSQDGSLYRIRFMPKKPGKYSYKVEFQQGDSRQSYSGTFTARDGKRRGLVRIDKEHPWHFIWEGTGEHYFWNATTTYWLLGWQDENVIQQAIDRLARLKVNRIRVALCGRTKSGDRWYEPLVVNNEKFQYRLNPWLAERPESVENPGFDVTRYNVPFWQKCDRMLRYAREKGMIVSIIFYLDGRDPGVDPFGKARMGCEEEQRYYRYGVARLAAFSNVMWDVSNEYRHFRDDAWAEKMGTLIKARDPYQHLTSIHGHGDFRFRTSPWADFAMYQKWDEAGGYGFMLKNRQAQAETGRPMPQINEEYGYEDHYPGKWGGGRKAPARSADNRRRLAWEMYMAGCYQTTGERADRGTGRGPDTGGGWLTGRGDDTMTMLEGYGHIVTCFTSLQWWKMEPRDDLVSQGAHCLAQLGQQYLVYLPSGGKVEMKLADGKYSAQWFNPRNGQWKTIGIASGPAWTSPSSADNDDWAIVLCREAQRPARIWNLTGPLGETPKHTTDAYPLSDQQNKGGWVKFEPMSDEFEGKELDLNKWHVGMEWWKGRQPALFSDKNVTVSDGKLHLTMRKEKVPEQFEKLGYRDYTSAALHTKARAGYGYYEVKARPMNSGGSSSFWFQVEDTPGWLTEIDVFEIGGKAKGYEQKYNMNLHVFRTPQEKKHWSVGGVWVAPWRLADDYHVYGLEWSKDEIKYFVDGVLVRSVENTHWHQPLYMIFDSETMPKWLGMPDDKDLPSTFSVEYVRAWKKAQ